MKPRYAGIMILMLLTVFGLMTACGARADNEAVRKLEERLQSLRLNEADISFVLPGEEKPDARKVLDEIQSRTVETLRTRIHFEWIPLDRYLTQLSKLSAAGDDREVYGYSEYFIYKQTGTGLRDMAERGALLDLNTIFPEYAPGLYGRYSKEVLATGQYQGKQLAIPMLTRKSKRLYAVVREDLMKRYKLPPIKTYSDYELYLEAVKSGETGITPGLVYNSSLFLFGNVKGYEVLDFYHGLVYKREGASIRIEGWEQTEAYPYAIEIMRKWYDKGYVLKNMALHMSDMPYNGLMNSGKYASCIDSFEGAYAILRDYNREHPDRPYGMYPLYPEEASSLESPMMAALVFNEKGRNPERALLFLEWIFAGQNHYDLFMYGIEGHHYLAQGEQYRLPFGVKVENHPYMGWSGAQFFRCMEYERSNADDAEQYKKRFQESITLNTVLPAYSGFTPDFEPIIEDSLLRMYGFYSGVDNPFSFEGLFLVNRNVEQVIREQNTQHLQNVITEVQNQIDRWQRENKR